MHNLEVALNLASVGLPVLPCNKDKKAILTDWPNQASTEPERVRSWFANGTSAPAINLKGTGLFVVDVDNHVGGPKGVKAFEELLKIHNADTKGWIIVRTPNGGFHIYFLQPSVGEYIRNTTGKIAPGIDTRGEGGYILAPDAILDEGKSYRALEGHPELVDAYKEGIIPVIPEWIAALIRKPKYEEAINGSAPSHRYADEAFKRECEAVATAPQGQRNHTLNKGAFNLGQLIPSGALSGSQVEVGLLQAALTAGLSKDEARATIASGLDEGKNRPRIVRDRVLFTQDKQFSSQMKEIADRVKPLPLRRAPQQGEPFPTEALGSILGGATKAIADIVQCPEGLAGCSILAAASFAAQAHANVVIPATQQFRPLSLYLFTVAATGERKSSSDNFAMRPVKKYEQKLREIHENEIFDYRNAKRAYDIATSNVEKKCKGDRYEIELALKAVGEGPKAPLLPHLICDEPSLEGLHKLYERGRPSLAIFSDEGGGFLGGHALKAENRLRTFAGLSQLWDGSSIRRTRAGDGSISLIGKRLVMHLMAQPEASQELLSDPTAKDQGLLSRVLVSAPPPLAGTRLQKAKSPTSEVALRHYETNLTALLEREVNFRANSINELDPRSLAFDTKAEKVWFKLADEIDAKLGVGGAYERIQGFGNKLAEHIARISGVLTIIENPKSLEINCDALERAVKLGDFFASEALRLFENGATSIAIIEAEKLLHWLRLWPEEKISLTSIYQLGPNSIRDKATALKSVKTLEDHGWLIKLDGGTHLVAGKIVRDAWRINRQEV